MLKAPPRADRHEGKYADQGEKTGGADTHRMTHKAGGGTRRSRGHWGILDNVIGGPCIGLTPV